MKHVVVASVVIVGCTPSSKPVDGDEAGLVDEIRSAGFAIQEGASVAFFIEDCAALPSCYGSNATSPYVLWHLPPAPGEPLLDQQGIEVPRTPPGMAPVWQLRDDEVVLYIARTPPPAAYFSYTPYLFARTDPSTNAPKEIFASLGDAKNLMNLATVGGDGAFDATTILIVTANRALEQRARGWLTAHGYDARSFNTVVIPSQQLHLGVEPADDIFMMLQRFALFEDAAAGAAYLADPPASLYRITPIAPQASDPLPAPPRGQRGTGTTEDALEPAVDALGAAIRVAHAGTPRSLQILPASVLDLVLDPDRCMSQHTNCLGEVTDTTYSAGPAAVITGNGSLKLADDPADFLIVYGVNHEASGKATYSNVIVQNQARLAGVASMTSREMAGSAERYLPNHPDAAKLFAIKIARRCGGAAHCIEVPTEFPGIPLDEDVSFTFRAYLEPGRTLSAAPDELFTERMFHFTP